MKVKKPKNRRKRIHKKIRAKVTGTKERPRLSIFRSSKHIFAQVINDEEGKTLVSVSDLKIKKEKMKGKIEKASWVGESLAKECKGAKITKVVFDRGGYKYHGRIKALADAAREEGLKF